MDATESWPVDVAVVIPCYRERQNILRVLDAVPLPVTAIYVIDDACPDGTGNLVATECRDPRVRVLHHERNTGVGGATVTGYRMALEDGADVIVKLDGDGQMDPVLIPVMVDPIVKEQADYTKGNRFYDLTTVKRMPAVRLVGNAVLSFLSKLSTGYWRTFDPNNGYTAISARVLRLLPLEKLHKGYFFESDILFRLNTVRAAVCDVPIPAIYASERSSLRVPGVIPVFTAGHTRNFAKRIFYNYFVRDFNIASVEWVLGPILLAFGLIFGVSKWMEAAELGRAATAGTVMVAALPTIIGLQFILSALNFDIDKQPVTPIGPMLSDDKRATASATDLAKAMQRDAEMADRAARHSDEPEEPWNVDYRPARR